MAFVIVAYDISHDRRRARMHTLLLGFGEPVQESLFECELDPPALRRLRQRLKRLVRPGDRVRVYQLGADCVGLTEDGHGNAPPPPPVVYTV